MMPQKRTPEAYINDEAKIAVVVSILLKNIGVHWAGML